MTEKICTRCKLTKPLEEYRLYKTRYIAKCIICEREYNKEQHKKNIEKRRADSKKWREANAETLKIKKHEYYVENKEKIDLYKNKYREDNKERILLRDREYYQKNRDRCLVSFKNYYVENWDKIRSQRKKYREENIELIKSQRKKWVDNNPKFRIAQALRKRVYSQLLSGKKYIELLGCSNDLIQKWFEFVFSLDEHLDLKWENYGNVWHIDHVIPVSSFDFDNDDEIIQCFHWTNVTPLLKKHNQSKSNKIVLHDILKQELRIRLFNKSITTAGYSKE